MKNLFNYTLSTLLICLCLGFTSTDSIKKEDQYAFNESFCKSSFNGDVTTYTLKQGNSPIGKSIWINRKSQRINAKYFAYKQNGSSVYQRYDSWKNGQNIVLMSSGAYATNKSKSPTGVTVDNGIIVNRSVRNDMDGLVIVYATGGIVVSNIEEGNLYLKSLGRKVDIRNYSDRTAFLNWAVQENATVFQTHLLAYKNQVKVSSYNSSSSKSSRKLMILAKASDGTLYHIIFYLKNRGFKLYDAASYTLNYLTGKGMNVISVLNLDTGMYDILDTNRNFSYCDIRGTSNSKSSMTNLIAYYYKQ